MIDRIFARLEEEKTKWKDIYELDRDKSFKNHYAMGRIRAFGDAIKIVQEVAKEYDNGWIQVSERLPEPFQRVLVYDALDDSITIEHLQENDSFIDSVVAWMPLPIAPYQKGE